MGNYTIKVMAAMLCLISLFCHQDLMAQDSQTVQMKSLQNKGSLLTVEQMKYLPDIFVEFTERFAKQILVKSTETDAVRVLQTNNMVLLKNTMNMSTTPQKWIHEVEALNNDKNIFVDFYLVDQDFSLVWKGSNMNYTLKGKVSRETIEGTDKAEAEILLFQEMAKMPHSSYNAPLPERSKLKVKENGMLANHGKSYILDNVDGTTFYRQTQNGLEAIFDKAYPVESLKNLMLGVIDKNRYKLRLLWPMYGGETHTMEISLKDYTDYWKPNKNFDVFCSATFVDGQYSIVHIIMHKVLKYAHVCTITFKQDDFEKGSAVLNGIFTSNIPQHNIQEIYH